MSPLNLFPVFLIEGQNNKDLPYRVTARWGAGRNSPVFLVSHSMGRDFEKRNQGLGAGNLSGQGVWERPRRLLPWDLKT